MKNKLWFRTLTFCFVLVLSFTGCKKSDNANSSNHTIFLYNYGSTDPGSFPAKQFTYMTITPVDLSSAPMEFTFLSKYMDPTLSISVKLPKTTSYKIAIYLTKGGQYLWWNSVISILR